MKVKRSGTAEARRETAIVMKKRESEAAVRRRASDCGLELGEEALINRTTFR